MFEGWNTGNTLTVALFCVAQLSLFISFLVKWNRDAEKRDAKHLALETRLNKEIEDRKTADDRNREEIEDVRQETIEVARAAKEFTNSLLGLKDFLGEKFATLGERLARVEENLKQRPSNGRSAPK